MDGILVVGTGSMGWNHARVCSELGLLVGICDRDEGVVKKVGENFGVPGFADLQNAIDETDPEGVIISTPTSTHHDVGTVAIMNGRNVLIEKPLAVDLEEGNRLVGLAREYGVTLAVGHIERHNPVISKARESLSSGDWGEIITISSRRVSNFPGRISDVGVILDLGIHDVDNVIFLMGSKPKSVYASGGKHHDILFEDHATIQITFENGNNALVEVNWITPMKVRTLSLTCEKSFVVLDYMNQQVTVSSSRFVDPKQPRKFPVDIEIDSRELGLNVVEPLRLEIEDFISSIRNGTKPLASGEDGLLALEICIAALESIKTGDVVYFE